MPSIIGDMFVCEAGWISLPVLQNTSFPLVLHLDQLVKENCLLNQGRQIGLWWEISLMIIQTGNKTIDYIYSSEFMYCHGEASGF